MELNEVRSRSLVLSIQVALMAVPLTTCAPTHWPCGLDVIPEKRLTGWRGVSPFPVSIEYHQNVYDTSGYCTHSLNHCPERFIPVFSLRPSDWIISIDLPSVFPDSSVISNRLLKAANDFPPLFQILNLLVLKFLFSSVL